MKIKVSLVNSKKRSFVFLVYIGETISITHSNIVCSVSVNIAYLHNNTNNELNFTIIFRKNVSSLKVDHLIQFRLFEFTG